MVLTVISLSNDDLPRMINGRPEDPIEKIPFNRTFKIERIQKSWENVGFLPFTRKCLTNNKVRSELGQTNPDEKLENLVKEYERLKIDLAAEGHNSECFDESIPTASKVAREETEEKMIQNLVDRGSTFSAYGLFMNTGNMMITSNSLLKASRKILLDREKDKVEKEIANVVEVQKKINIGLTA